MQRSLVRFVLIPVADTVPALREQLECAQSLPLDAADDRRELLELATSFVALSAPLLRYAQALAGRPSEN